MTDKQKLLKAVGLLEQVMGNYQVAASVADMEGYETNYAQDVILVGFLKDEVKESNNAFDLTYLNGVTRGQQIIVDTMRRLIASKPSFDSMTATLDLIEKQLSGNNE